jgi:hypothetical protein
VRVYAGLLIRANRDTYTHVHTYTRARRCYLDAKRNGNKSHTQKGKFVIISKEYQKQKNRQNKEQKHICFTFVY